MSKRKIWDVQTARPEVQLYKYEIAVATLVAATLSNDEQIETYQVFTNLKEAYPFDDVVAKVLFKGDNVPYAFAMQVKHRSKGETLAVGKYLKGYNEIFSAGGFKTIGVIAAENIHFSYFCIKDVRTKDYKLSAHKWTTESWRAALSFKNCHTLSPNKSPNEQVQSQIANKKLEDFLNSFCLYLHQPSIEGIKKQIKNMCKVDDVTVIWNYVDRFFEKDILWSKGLHKEVFETELLRIRLSDYILPLTNIMQISNSQAVLWNKLTLQYNVTIVKTEADIEKILYGYLAQLLNRLLNDTVNWNTFETNTLDSSVINEFKRLFIADESGRIRHWIDPPTTLKGLIIELWKCGELPLILKSDHDLPVLKEYRHLDKSVVIVTEDLVSRREEYNRYQLRVFTHISDIKCLHIRDELLKTITVSLHGGKPITLYSIIAHHEKLTRKLPCSYMLQLMVAREAYLSKAALDVNHNLIFLIEDPTASTKYNIDAIDKSVGNIIIWCRPEQISKYRKQIEMNPKFYSYHIYHCVASLKNEHFILIEGNELLLRDFFVDQYGESVYNLYGTIAPVLGDTLRSVQQNYIPRFLRSALISKTLFTSRTKGICFFSGDLTYLDVNTKINMVKVASDEIEKKIQFSNENVFIYIESEDIDKYWEKASKFKCPLLHIRIENAGMYLCKCSCWNGLIDHISFTGQTIPEEMFLEEIKDGITVLTGESGIGKTSLLKSLLQNYNMEKYILYYNLAEEKPEWLTTESSLDSILVKFRTTRYNEFLIDLFKGTKDLVIFLDSFDEVALSHKEKILSFIRNLASTNFKIIIASRPIATYIVMNNFETNIFKLGSLRADDCREYISYLSEEELATVPSEFVENPLDLKFLKIISENNGPLTSISKFDLFRAMISIKLNQYFDRYFSSDHESDKEHLLNRVLELHQKLALVRILGVDVMEKLGEWQRGKTISNQLRLGIILSIDENCYPTFVNETFSEYLTADWIIKNNTTDSAKYIYQEMLKQNKLYVLNIVCDHLVLHKAVLEENRENIEIYARDRSHLETTDALGRTAAHIAAANRKQHLKQQVILRSDEPIAVIIRNMRELKVNITSSDILMQWDWVQHMNGGNAISLIMHPKLPPLIMGAYVSCIAQKLCAGIELCIKDNCDEVEELYESGMNACDIHIVRDLFFVEDATRNGVRQAFLHRECQALEADELNLRKIKGLTPLHVACIYGNVKAVRESISLKHRINATDKFGCTPLHYSVINPPEVCMDMTKVLLENGSTVDVVNEWKTTPIKLAILSGNVNIVELFFKTYTPDSNMLLLLFEYEKRAKGIGICALQSTIAPKQYIDRLVESLLARGIDLNVANEDGETALLTAVRMGNFDRAKLLLECGADVNSAIANGITPLICASKMRQSTIVVLLLENGANVNSVTTLGETALMFASKNDNLNIVKLLLEKGATVNSATLHGETPLMFASQSANSNIVKLLLEKCDNVNSTTIHGETSLMFASKEGKSNTVKLLLEKSANINSTTAYGETALMFASGKGNSNIVRLLLQNGANVNSTTADGETPLMFASKEGKSNTVKLLLQNGAMVNSITTHGKTPLTVACEGSHFDIVKILLKCNADVNSTTADGKTALILAFERSNLDVVKILLKYGADVNCTIKYGKTLLTLALENNDINLVKILLESGADINLATTDGKTPLMFAFERGDSDIVKILLEYGLDVNSTATNGKTLLIYASERGNSDVVRILLNYDAYVNSTTTSGKTALMFASERSYADVAKLLLEYGADVNCTTTDGKTALMFASETDNSDLVEILLEYCANVNSTTTYGKTPLIFAFERGNADVVNMLLKHGADVKCTTADGKTLLMFASETGNSYLVKLLLDKNADVMSVTIDGKTSLMFASERGNSDVVKILLKYGADVNSRTRDGKQPLIFAVENDNTDVVNMLLEHEADVDSTTTDIKTPLMTASERGNLDLVEILLEHGAQVNCTTTDSKTSLAFASERDNYDIVKMLLKYGADVNSATTNNKTPLISACERGNVELVKILLEYDADIDSSTIDNKTPLMSASESGNIELVNVLLEYGADVDSTTTNGKTPLMFASESNNYDVVNILLEYDANVDSTTTDGKTPLMFASERNNCDVVKVLLECGADVDRATTDGKTPLMFASERNNYDVVKILLEYDANVDNTTKDGKTPLMFASENKNLRIIELLVEYGANIHSKTTEGKTVLMYASEMRNLDIVKLLLERILEEDAEIDTATVDKTVLMCASEVGCSDAVKLLLEENEKVNSSTEAGKTALMYACGNNNTATVKLLLETKADVNSTTTKGKSPLMYASEIGNSDIVELLLEYGADVNSETIYEQTPLTFACEKGDLDVTKLLLKKGASMNCVTTDGETLLMHASKNGTPDLITFLLDAGATVDSKTPYNETALMYACRCNNLPVVELLLKRGAVVDNRTIYGLTSLMCACQIGEFGLVKLLLEAKANVNSATLTGETPLMFAIIQGNQLIVELLLEKDADVNSKTIEGRTPLTFACSESKYNLVKLLINKGAMVNDVMKDEETALTVACREYNLEIIRLLIEKGADTQNSKIDGKTLFVYACEEYMEELMRLLIEKGADVNSTTEDRDTPLIIASQMNDLETVQLLLQKDCDVNAVDVNDRSALYYAINCASHYLRNTNLEIIRLLLDKNAAINDECYEAAKETENSAVIEMIDEERNKNAKK